MLSTLIDFAVSARRCARPDVSVLATRPVMIRRQGSLACSRDQRLRLIAGAALLLLTPFAALPLNAQDGGIFGRGDAVVTGFSGTKHPIRRRQNPLDETFIDLDGASARIFRLEPGAPASGQLITAPPVLQVKARDVGQVFAITLDDRPSCRTQQTRPTSISARPRPSACRSYCPIPTATAARSA